MYILKNKEQAKKEVIIMNQMKKYRKKPVIIEAYQTDKEKMQARYL